MGGLLLVSCGGSAAPIEGATRVELGTGETEFVPVAEGDPVELVAGLQGGFHVPVSFRAYGYASDRLTLEASARVDAPGWPQAAPIRAAVRVEPLAEGGADSAQGFNGFPLVLDNARCAHGLAVELSIAVSDEGSGRATDRRWVELALDEGLRSDDCGP